jgi:glycosyltransferase involved in cell wall biosynthesis
MPALRIVHVDTEARYSGGEVQVFLLLEGLRSRGHHVVLLCRPGSACAQEAERRGMEYRTLRMRNQTDLPAVLRLRRDLLEVGADVVHLHTSRANWLGGLAARAAGIPAVSTRRMDRRVRAGMRTRFLYRALLQRTAAISPAVRDLLLKAGVPSDRVEVIVDAVDPRSLRPQSGRDEVRARLGADTEHCIVIAVAALVRRKGLDVLLDAVAGLGAARMRVLVWIVGEGSERAALEQQARRIGVAAQTSFLGWRDDVADLLHAADIAVLPSRREGMGVAALEAMAVGRAVIASNVGGLAHAVVHERTGLLVAPNDAAALASALARLIRDPDLRQRLADGGPPRIAESFQPEQMVSAYERLYADVVSKSANTAAASLARKGAGE